MNRRFLLLAVLTTSLIGFSAIARADADFSFSLGYSHITMDGSAGAFDSQDGFRMEPRFTFGVSEKYPQLRLGFGLGFSYYYQSLSDGSVIIDNDGDTVTITSGTSESLSTIEPEFQVSWRQLLGKRFYLEPGIGIGGVIGNYYVGSDWWWGGDYISEWAATYSGRPFLRAGWEMDSWLIGLEASYLFGGNLDFSNAVGGNIQEFYAGFFFGGRW